MVVVLLAIPARPCRSHILAGGGGRLKVGDEGEEWPQLDLKLKTVNVALCLVEAASQVLSLVEHVTRRIMYGGIDRLAGWLPLAHTKDSFVGEGARCQATWFWRDFQKRGI